MIHKPNLGALRMRLQSTSLLAIAAVVAAAGLAPLYYQGSASAATLSSRKVAISDSTPDKDGVTYTFTFTIPTLTQTIQSMIFQFCNTPLGTCVLPGTDGTPTAAEKIDVDAGTTTYGGITGFDGTTVFAEVNSDTGGCTDADGGGVGLSTMYCLNRTDATTESTNAARTVTISNVSNPIITSGNNEPVYVRITTYSDTGFATPVDSGTVAASIVNQLTVTGRVQERLVFCVFALDDAAGSSSTVGAASTNYPTNCSAAEATASSNVDIGVVDNISIASSPVDNSPPTSIGNDRFGAAMVNTNASNGVTVAYYPATASSGTNQLRSFRVSGASCNASNANLTDQCFQDASTSGTTFAAGTEDFGLAITCVANNGTQASAGTTSNLGSGNAGNGTAGTYNDAYDNNSGTATFNPDLTDDGSDDCENSDANDFYSWDSSGSPVNLISSTTVVDDELIKMRFAAAAAATTPTGTYTVATIYIATPVF